MRSVSAYLKSVYVDPFTVLDELLDHDSDNEEDEGFRKNLTM